ncbi:MAG: arylformamidase [Verrucomicrobiales bacterium]|jgi:arylformamidase
MDNVPWQHLSDAEREREYSPSSCVGGDLAPFLDAYATQSRVARELCASAGSPVLEIRYGPADSQTIDLVVPPGEDGPWPLVVFIHGGYWQELSKQESFFPAADCLAHNVAYAAIDYTLAPSASIDDIVSESHLAIGALRTLDQSHRIDVGRIVVCGSSAGAHLAAMVGLGSPDGFRPAGVGLVSGIFEMEPLLGTSINNAVRLDDASAHRNSPMRAPLDSFPPTLIAYGDNETSEFKRQSDDFALGLSSAGVSVEKYEVLGRNHFDVILELCDEDSTLGEALYRLISLSDPTSGRPIS